MFVSKYWKKYPESKWKKRLYQVKTRAGTDKFSIGYRFYSTKNLPIRYVGRADSPFNRQKEHCSQIRDNKIHDRLGGRIYFSGFHVLHWKKTFQQLK